MSELQELVLRPNDPESETFERKADFRSDVAKTVAAMLNSNGGWIVVGADDQGHILGLADAERDIRHLRDSINARLVPPALWSSSLAKVDGKEIVVIEVPSGAEKPYLLDGTILVRRGAETVVPSSAEIGRVIARRQGTDDRWERRPALGITVEDLERAEVEWVLEAAARRGETFDSVEAFLARMGLVRNEAVTNAAVVLFHPSPGSVIPQSRSRFAVYETVKTGDHYLDNRVLDAPLLSVLRLLEENLRRFSGVRSSFTAGFQREERPHFPLASLREGILNALVHRDYSSWQGGTSIELYPDRCEIWNFGALPHELTPDDLKRPHPSLPRNPDIAHVAFLAGFMEKLGRGTQKIVYECREFGLALPEWTTGPTGTRLIIPLVRIELGRVSIRERKIIKSLQESGPSGLPGIYQRLGEPITQRTLRKDLERLVSYGYVRRTGKGKNIRYVASEEIERAS